MRLGNFLIAAFAVTSLLIATQGCALIGGADATKEDKLCTPGAFVFCRCADRAEGTKLCKTDGKSFEACQTTGDGECVGGEIPDEKTNTEVDPGSSSGGTDPQKPDPPGAIEECPGKSTAVQPGVELKIEGDTTQAVNDREGRTGACAVGAGGKDHIYRIIPSGSGSLEVKVQGISGMNPLAYIRTTCADKESQVSCAPPGPNALAQLKTNVSVGKDYFLIVDGASASVGKYSITAKLTTGAFCGDGKIDTGEACDDGNKVEGDGCGNDCKHIDGNPTTGAACPGQPVDLWTGTTITGAGSTTAPSYGNAWSAPDKTCFMTGTNTYADHIYEVTPHASGTITVTVTPTGSLNFMLTARKTCSDPASATASMCKNDASTGGAETMTLAATANTKLYVAVDGGGISSNKGDYTISFKLQ
jgi:cysteine-rich repeat protein